jgi:hypothetical protein
LKESNSFQKNGVGILTYASGIKFQSEWVDGIPVGIGGATYKENQKVKTEPFIDGYLEVGMKIRFRPLPLPKFL